MVFNVLVIFFKILILFQISAYINLVLLFPLHSLLFFFTFWIPYKFYCCWKPYIFAEILCRTDRAKLLCLARSRTSLCQAFGVKGVSQTRKSGQVWIRLEIWCCCGFPLWIVGWKCLTWYLVLRLKLVCRMVLLSVYATFRFRWSFCTAFERGSPQLIFF